MRITAAAATDVGRVRDGNEDAFLNEAPLFAVADGMGGHQGGEVASRLALDTLEALFRRRRGALAEHVREANRAVYERSARDAAVAGMGTTLTAAVAEADRLRLAHVGDSRAYLLRDGSLRLLTQDHTLVHRMIERGEISEREAQVHPHRSMLVRSVGTEPDVDVDEVVVDVEDGDRILLCTDGLTGMVDDEQLEEILARNREPRDAVRELVAAANRQGGADNITAVVLDVSIDAGDRDAASSGAANVSPQRGGGRAGTRASERGRLVRRVLAWGVMVALILVVAVFGVRFYLDQQWYVGESNGRVAIFRGIPSEVLGVPLGHAVVVTALPADAAQRLQFYRQLPIGISAESRAAADDIVRQIGVDLRRADAARQRALQDRRVGSAGGGGSGGSGTQNGGSDGQHGSGHHHARMAA